jgi:hypothetical protein
MRSSPFCGPGAALNSAFAAATAKKRTPESMRPAPDARQSNFIQRSPKHMAARSGRQYQSGIMVDQFEMNPGADRPGFVLCKNCKSEWLVRAASFEEGDP